MVLKPQLPLLENQIAHEPLLLAQKDFKHKTFSIVTQELHKKITALGFDEVSLNAMCTSKNALGDYLEFIDRCFEPLQIIHDYFFNEHLKIISSSSGKKSSFLSPQEETKKNLSDILALQSVLKKLFSTYPQTSGALVVDAFSKDYFSDLMYLLWHGKDGVKYQFDPLVLQDFFQQNFQNKNSINNKHFFPLLRDAYEDLWECTHDRELFNNLLRLSIMTGSFHTTSLYQTFISYTKEDKIFFVNHFYFLFELGKILGKNTPTFLGSPHAMSQIIQFSEKYSAYSDILLRGLGKLGPDSLYLYYKDIRFLENIFARFPHRCEEFCQNLKTLADLSQNNEDFYTMCLHRIDDFLFIYPEKWEYLLKIGEIFQHYTPWVLRTAENFVSTLFEKYPQEYEEILKEIRNIWEEKKTISHEDGDLGDAKDGNLFFSYGLQHFSGFLSGGKEDFFHVLRDFTALYEMTDGFTHDQENIFFQDGLELLVYYMKWFPEALIPVGKKIIKIIAKNAGKRTLWEEASFLRQYLDGFGDAQFTFLLDNDPRLLEDMVSFLEKIAGSKDSVKIIASLKRFDYAYGIPLENYNETELQNWREVQDTNKKTISYALAYLLRHKKSKVIPFIKNIHLIHDLDLGMNIPNYLFGGVSLEYLCEEELTDIFCGDSVENTKIWKSFIKIKGTHHPKSQEMHTRIASLLPKKGKTLDKKRGMPTLKKIQNLFADILFEYFNERIHKKIHLKFQREFGLSKDFQDVLLDENLIEFYKMYRSTSINKEHAFDLIQRYLNGEVYTGTGKILEYYPYNRQENQWFLAYAFGSKSSFWVERNQRTFHIGEDAGDMTQGAQERITHHLNVANEKLVLLADSDSAIPRGGFTTSGKLIDYFDTVLKKDTSYTSSTLFHDIELQVKMIKSLLTQKNAQKISQVTIYHELDPLKIAMMGNWVDGSCLSYYNPTGNYWSVITNALEVNKGVFYFEDQYGNVIARILVGIDQDGNLEVHPPYMKGNLEVNIKPYFIEYITDLADRLGKHLQGKREKVPLLFCEGWYKYD